MLRHLFWLLIDRVILALIDQIPIPAIIVTVIALAAVTIFIACLLSKTTDKHKNK
jgi:hypothetical protein